MSGVSSSPKKVTYKDVKDKQERKAQRRQNKVVKALKGLKTCMTEKGVEHSETVDALENYVQQCCSAATSMIDSEEHDGAASVLQQCVGYLRK